MNSPLYFCSLCSNGGIIGGADDDAGWVEHMRRTHGVHITVADLRDFRERRAQRACSLDEYVDEIRALRAAGKSLAELGQMFRVSSVTISNVVNRRGRYAALGQAEKVET